MKTGNENIGLHHVRSVPEGQVLAGRTRLKVLGSKYLERRQEVDSMDGIDSIAPWRVFEMGVQYRALFLAS